MKTKKLLISYIIIFITSVIFIIGSCSNKFNFTYLFALVLFVILSLYNFITGIEVNNKENYKKNINIYIILYFILLICLTMFIGRSGFGLINSKYLKYYIDSINIIPFKTIIGFVFGNQNANIKFYNLIGNLVVLMPISLLLTLKDDKYKKIKNQFLSLSIIVVIIEFLQLILSTGSFDVDDYILNVGGGLLFFIFISKFKLIDRIKKLFYTDFNLKTTLKKILYYILVILVIVIDVLIVFGLMEAYSHKSNIEYNNQQFYVETLDDNSIKELNINDDYNIYLVNSIVIYEENNTQMQIQDALKNGYLDRNKIIEKLKLVYALYDGGTTIYKKSGENITVILCSTLDGNNDIYFGNYDMNYQESYCKNK